MTPRLQILISFVLCSILIAACSSSKKPEVKKAEKTGAGSTDPLVTGTTYPPIDTMPTGDVPPADVSPTETEEQHESGIPGGETEDGETLPGGFDPTTPTILSSGGSGLDTSKLKNNPIGELFSRYPSIQKS